MAGKYPFLPVAQQPKIDKKETKQITIKHKFIK
jgi:hypothetical protein